MPQQRAPGECRHRGVAWSGATKRTPERRASCAASDAPVTSGSRRTTSRTGGCVVSREPARKVRVEVTPPAQHAARSPHSPRGPARRVPGVLHDRGAAPSARPAHRRGRGSRQPTKRSPCGQKGHSRCADVKVPMVTGMGGSAAAGAPRGRRLHGARTRSRSRRHGRPGPEVCARYGHAARGCGPWPVACNGAGSAAPAGRATRHATRCGVLPRRACCRATRACAVPAGISAAAAALRLACVPTGPGDLALIRLLTRAAAASPRSGGARRLPWPIPRGGGAPHSRQRRRRPARRA